MIHERDTLGKIQAIATIVSLVAIPIVIAIVGWAVQEKIADQTTKKDYVLMAVGILNKQQSEGDEELRRWAIEVLDKNAPVPFTKDIKIKLESGAYIISLPKPPPELMVPPRPLATLPVPAGETQ